MAEVSRLYDCIEKGVSHWLSINQFEYDLVHMNNLIRSLDKLLNADTDPGKVFSLIEEHVGIWRKEKKMDCELDEYNELIAGLDDRVTALITRIQQDERLRHAS